MKKLLAADITSSTDICYGPMCGQGTSPMQNVGALFSKAIYMFVIVGSLVALVYILWGALDWITSEGEKDKLAKARQKILQAVIGMIILFSVVGIWGFLVGDVLGILVKSGNGWTLKIPSLVGGN